MGKHHKTIIRQVIERFDDLMAIGESRFDAKKEAREAAKAAGEDKIWSFTTGKIHSHKTRVTYQEHTLRFVTWVRDTHGIKELVDLDPRADELASLWLQMEVDKGQSPYTLQTERSALRMFFGDRTLASSVTLPKRLGENITRSRLPAARDRNFQPKNWPEFMTFERAAGLRKDELKEIRVGEVYYTLRGQLVAYVRNGKGGKDREAPILALYEQAVLALLAGRKPEEPVLLKVPDTDVHALRREYAQSLYQQYAPGAPSLPPKSQRLKPTDYDRDAAKLVSEALGHSRLDVVLGSYLR